GFLALLAGLVVLAFVLRKGLPPVFMYLVTRPMRQMGAVLRGARIVVHSVTPCEPPPREDWEGDGADDAEDDGRRIADRPDPDDDNEDGDGGGDEAEDFEDAEQGAPVGPADWYQIELTVVPPDAGPSEGRIVTRRGWTPQLIGAVGPRPPMRASNPFRGWPPADQFPWSVQHVPVELWTGSEYEIPEEQVFGEQRLRLRVGVSRDVRAVTITYAHFTDIGEVPLPRMDVSADRDS
ncbi:MAG TPA: hypothetical protein VKD90_23610, partial [Gemmataceae bacterium]|nr:hypothetical protein [Gemmataceae bacterium]